MVILKKLNRNGIRALEAEWDFSFHENHGLFETYRPYLEHAYRMCPLDDESSQGGAYELFGFDNGTSSDVLTKIVIDEANSEIRIVWNLWHPRYEENPPSAAVCSYVTACFINEAIDLANTLAGAPRLMIFMQNAVDRSAVEALVAKGQKSKSARGSNSSLRIAGNWLCVDDVIGGHVSMPPITRSARTRLRAA